MPKFSPMQKAVIEQETYKLASQFCYNYVGGMWAWNSDYGYFVLDSDEALPVSVATNGFADSLDALTFSLGVATVLHNQMAWRASAKGRDDIARFFSDSFYAVRNHALDTLNDEQKSLYLRFID